MRDQTEPKLAKWPFFFGDFLLLCVAVFIYSQSQLPIAVPQLGLIAGCVALGAILALVPFLLEYHATVKLAEAASLTTIVAQIQHLQDVATQITSATNQWSHVQEQADKTAAEARQITERMKSEAKAFVEFMERINDSEKATLKLEVDKLRRAENDWLQVLVRMLDHVYALHQGAVRSRQPNVIQQVGQFQSACRDVARRIGLTPFTAAESERYDAQRHQLLEPNEGNTKAPADATVAETIAAGYTFQGKLLRPALVRLQTNGHPKASQTEGPASEPADQQSQLFE